jgi:hypothetical protein
MKKYLGVAAFFYFSITGFTQAPNSFIKEFPESGLQLGMQNNAYIWEIQKHAFGFPDNLCTGNYTEGLKNLLIKYFRLNGEKILSTVAPKISYSQYLELIRVNEDMEDIYNGKYKIHYRWASCYIENDEGDTSFYTLNKQLIGSKFIRKEGDTFDLPPAILNSFTENCFDIPFGNQSIILFEAPTEDNLFILLLGGTELGIEIYKSTGIAINKYLKGGVISLILNGKYAEGNHTEGNVTRDFRLGKLSRTKSPSGLKTNEKNVNSSSITIQDLDKITNIRDATKTDVINILSRKEFKKEGGKPSFGMRISKDGTFRMYFSYEKKDEYSQVFKTTLRNGFSYSKQLSGTYKLYEANIKQMGRGLFNEPIKNEYGEIQPDHIFIRYYIVFTGQDEGGNTYNMCTRLYQFFDATHMHRWYLDFTNVVNECNCSCSTGDGKRREAWIQGFYLQGDE